MSEEVERIIKHSAEIIAVIKKDKVETAIMRQTQQKKREIENDYVQQFAVNDFPSLSTEDRACLIHIIDLIENQSQGYW